MFTKKQNSIFLEDTTSEEVMCIIINEFQNTKSSDIPINVIKHIWHTIAPYLCKLYNSCISLGDFPSCLKIDRITPIYKKGSKNDVSNYNRPVSTLPIFGKMLKNYFTADSITFLLFYIIVLSCQVLTLDSEIFTRPVTQMIVYR